MAITIRIDVFQSDFVRAIAGHVGDMRHALRALEDGSYVERAQAPSAGSIVALQFPGGLDADAVHRQTSRCFRSIIADSLTFMDRVIGAVRLVRRGLQLPPDAPTDPTAVLNFLQGQLEDEINSVTTDRGLSGPKKVEELGVLSDHSKAEVLSYLAARNALEHHAGIARQPLTVHFQRLELFFGDRTDEPIKSFPAEARAGEAISIHTVARQTSFAVGDRVVFSEADIDDVVMTLQIFSAEVVEGLKGRSIAETHT